MAELEQGNYASAFHYLNMEQAYGIMGIKAEYAWLMDGRTVIYVTVLLFIC